MLSKECLRSSGLYINRCAQTNKIYCIFFVQFLFSYNQKTENKNPPAPISRERERERANRNRVYKYSMSGAFNASNKLHTKRNCDNDFSINLIRKMGQVHAPCSGVCSLFHVIRAIAFSTHLINAMCVCVCIHGCV